MERQKVHPTWSRILAQGTLGGLAGGTTKILGEMVFPPRSPGEPIPPVVAYEKVTDHLVAPGSEAWASQLFHWPFSIGSGLVYCALAEFFPVVTIGRGAGFGVVLWLCTHATLVPWLGLSRPFAEIPFKEHLSEILTHILFGMTIEAVRQALVKRPSI